jgi:hypothetical protein
MASRGTYYEQCGEWFLANPRRFRVRVRPRPPRTWPLRPKNYKVDPCLIFWAMCAMRDARTKDGVSYRTLWLAFREPPYLHPDRLYYDGEAVVVNHEPVLDAIIAPGFSFEATVDGRNSVAQVEVL